MRTLERYHELDAYTDEPVPNTPWPATYSDLMATTRRLTKSHNKLIAGVCAGCAEYLGWDTTAFRVAFVLVSILSAAFPGILMYLVLWALMPPPENQLTPPL
jgi:phage shock protein C